MVWTVWGSLFWFNCDTQDRLCNFRESERPLRRSYEENCERLTNITIYSSSVCSFVSLKNLNSSSQTRHPRACMWWGGDGGEASRMIMQGLLGWLPSGTSRRCCDTDSQILCYELSPRRGLGNECFPDPALVPYLSLSKREGGYFCYGWITVQATQGRRSAQQTKPCEGRCGTQVWVYKMLERRLSRVQTRVLVRCIRKGEVSTYIFFK